MVKLVILISGFGSNLQAIIDAIQAKNLDAEIVAVISDNPNANGLERARKANVPALVLAAKQYPDRQSYDTALIKLIDDLRPDLIVLAGFMRILGASFVQHYPYKILNIHPSLLPKYPGLHTHAKALEAGDKVHGSTVHIVTEDLDAGPIIAQARLSVLADDTAESLKQRVQHIEHQLYPLVLQWFSTGRIHITPQAIVLDGLVLPQDGYQIDFDKENRAKLA